VGREGRKNAHQAKPCRPPGRSDAGEAREIPPHESPATDETRIRPSAKMTDRSSGRDDKAPRRPPELRNPIPTPTPPPRRQANSRSPQHPSPTIVVERPFPVPAGPRLSDLAAAIRPMPRPSHLGPRALADRCASRWPASDPLDSPTAYTATLTKSDLRLTAGDHSRPRKIRNLCTVAERSALAANSDFGPFTYQCR